MPVISTLGALSDKGFGGFGVGNRPLNTVKPYITGFVSVGQTITGNIGTWVYSPPATFLTEWIVDSSIVGTNTTYTLTRSNAGKYISFGVSATDRYGQTTAYSIASYVPVVVPLAPTIGSASRVSSTNYKQIYVSFAEGDTGGEAPLYTVTSSNGVITATGYSSPVTVTVPISYMNTSLTYSVTATNSAGTSASSGQSNSITTAPSVGTNLGPSIGYYLGNNRVMNTVQTTSGSWTACNTYLTNNVTNTSYTTAYNFFSITELTTYRTVAGIMSASGSGPYWSNTPGIAGTHYQMTYTGSTYTTLDSASGQAYWIATLLDLP